MNHFLFQHKFDINVGGDYLEEAKQIELLGVIFESNMRFAAQIQKISTNCWGVLRYLYQLSTLHKTLKLYLVKALILSRIDYANTVLIGSNEADLKPLNAVSRAALRYVFSK